MDTYSIAANHFVQICRLICTFVSSYNRIQFSQGTTRRSPHRSRATEKEHCHLFKYQFKIYPKMPIVSVAETSESSLFAKEIFTGIQNEKD